jgi:hypothetical protein
MLRNVRVKVAAMAVELPGDGVNTTFPVPEHRVLHRHGRRACRGGEGHAQRGRD